MIRTLFSVALLSLALSVSVPTTANAGDFYIWKVFEVLSEHLPSIKKASWEQVYWQKRAALAAERCR